MHILMILAAVLITVAGGAQRSDTLSLGDFETWTWQGLERSTEQVKQGEFSGKWANPVQNPTIRPARAPSDWSGYDRLTFWMYSGKANGQQLTLVCNSENEADAEGWDYYFLHFSVDWEGWKFFNLRLGGDIQPTRKPAGWNKIDYVSINAGGWQHSPLPDTVIYLDDVKLVRDPVHAELRGPEVSEEDGVRRLEYAIDIENRSVEARSFALVGAPADPDKPAAHRLTDLPVRTPEIEPGKTVTVRAALTAARDRLDDVEPLTREEFVVRVETGNPDVPSPEVVLGAAIPLQQRQHPFLFATPETIERAKKRAAEHDWAAKTLEGILTRARSAATRTVGVPEEAGQWSHHYVCKKCGSGLKHEGGKHLCRKCGAEYTGWPYDQVVVSGIHTGYWKAVFDLGLGYAFTADESFAAKAREILLAYAEQYPKWPIHDSRGKESRSGARMLAQTLDEAVSIIHTAWGYDLLYNSPVFSPEDRDAIENGFFREVVKTIRRNDSGISNWQSWHNAGMAAVGFCLQDEEIASAAINGRSGLRFQLRNSILPDGFWYEGTAAYHYYALQAIRWATEAAYFAGIDLYGNAALKSLYDAPLLYTFPDLSFPAVNDSDVFSIKGQHALYELAYARFGDPAHLVVAQEGKRSSLEAFLWGADELPPAPVTALESRDFEGLGAAVLRQGTGADQLYVHLDYGPHGGGHGHPDKMTLILFGLGRQLAPDPARLAYAAPLHGSWYRQTFAHNTVCVDQRSQQATEGRLTVFHSSPGLAVAGAECDTAYPGVMLRRTVALTGEYLVDLFEVESEDEHTYDWLWHNFGELRPGMATEPGESPGTDAGYQHMKDVRIARADGDWTADFAQDQANVRVTMAGEPGTKLYFGAGMANNPPVPCPMLIARRQGKRTLFASVIEPYRDEPRVTGLRILPMEDGNAVEVQISRGQARDLLLVAREPGVTRSFGGIQTTARVCFVREADDAAREVHHVE